jgi:hypothetical protein
MEAAAAGLADSLLSTSAVLQGIKQDSRSKRKGKILGENLGIIPPLLSRR